MAARANPTPEGDRLDICFEFSDLLCSLGPIGSTLCQQRICAGTHALKIDEIESNQIESAAVGCSVLLYLCGRGFRLCQIPRLQRAPHARQETSQFQLRARPKRQPTRAAIKRSRFYSFGASTEAFNTGNPDQELSGVCTIPLCSASTANASNFNGTPIPSGDYIWFNANFTASGIPSTGATISFQGSTIKFENTTLTAPNAQIMFSTSVTCATTSFSNNLWTTIVPISGSDEIFLSGLAFLVPSGGLPGGINPVTWTGTFTSNKPGVSVNWKWGAAVYTTFSTDYNSLGVKPTHSNSCSYHNSDHAGTPENFKSFVTGGARGGGGSNLTGSWSGTVSVIPVCH